MKGMGLSEPLLFPEDQDGSHDEVANEFITGIDGEKLHVLFGEQGSRELDRGDETEPNMKEKKSRGTNERSEGVVTLARQVRKLSASGRPKLF
jgi:hypothetical protein